MLITKSGQCCGGGQPEDIRTRVPDGLKPSISKPEAPETGCSPLKMKNRGEKKSGSCWNPIHQSDGTSKSRRMLTPMTRNGRSTLTPGGPLKHWIHQKVRTKGKYPNYLRVKPGAARCLRRGLSRMRGNSQVRFLGGGGAVMRRCYPTMTATVYALIRQWIWLLVVYLKPALI